MTDPFSIKECDMRSPKSHLAWTIFTLALLLAVSLSSQLAFGDNVYGSIRGSVTDPSGAALPNVTVTVTDLGTGIQTTAKSSTDGSYTFPQLTIGTYRVSAS